MERVKFKEGMINSKSSLHYYMEEDRKVYHIQASDSIKTKLKNLLFRDRFYEYMKCLRKLEYYSNIKSRGGAKYLKYYYAYKLGKMKCRTGIDLDPNVAGAGLHIPHGKVVINPNAHIGEHCKIYSDVTIGIAGKYSHSDAPVIEDRVFIGSGAKIIGNVHIAKGCVIGANAVVTQDILEEGITVAGCPARKISNEDSTLYIP